MSSRTLPWSHTARHVAANAGVEIAGSASHRLVPAAGRDGDVGLGATKQAGEPRPMTPQPCCIAWTPTYTTTALIRIPADSQRLKYKAINSGLGLETSASGREPSRPPAAAPV